MKTMIEFEGICRRKLFVDPSKIVAFMEAVSLECNSVKKGSIIYLVGDKTGIYVQESYVKIKEFLLSNGVEQASILR